MLQASRVVKSFGGFQALAGCSLEIARQSITGIIGPNGAGKSTLFNVLGGLLAPDSGDVSFEGRSIPPQTLHACFTAIAAHGLAA